MQAQSTGLWRKYFVKTHLWSFHQRRAYVHLSLETYSSVPGQATARADCGEGPWLSGGQGPVSWGWSGRLSTAAPARDMGARYCATRSTAFAKDAVLDKAKQIKRLFQTNRWAKSTRCHSQPLIRDFSYIFRLQGFCEKLQCIKITILREYFMGLV